ncbi:unnamed protein product [Brachionus calyciflorus]|uniref:Valine--tRNA ligase n=1 Tax=Brachionus calyciflorus TaxID=104777 RepID=A0A813WYW4_9BILA|nr:unnamed protein product [Brachionus calyciflorus]
MSNFVQKLADIEASQKDLRQRASNLEARMAKLEITSVKSTNLVKPPVAVSTTTSENLTSKSQDDQPQKEKSATQLKKEAKQKEKDEKFKAKQEKLKATQAAPKETKPKVEEKKEKEPQSVRYTSQTKVGEKKDTKCQLPDAYSPPYVEASWYEWWEQMGFFKPEIADKYFPLAKDEKREKFVMAMPPPNVTGTLHLGHALMCSIEDVLTRWHRQLGHETLWCPGFDHAGIATQVVVEKKIKREQNKTRHDLGREAFVEEIWKWKNEKGDTIAKQLKRIGSSCDWDRARFTMDEVSVKAVLETFIRMHEKGLIYRNKRLVNWSCALNSAISDIEVDKTPLKGRTFLSIPGYKEKIEFGTLTSFAYKVVESKDSDVETGEEIVIATTRPETMLGDTAICVHPNDERYKNLVGKYVTHPFVNRKIPIIADEMVDPSFGTGAVKITPAHDANDFECGRRHDLPFITIIDDKGLITSEGGQFAGQKRFEARKSVVQALKEKGLFKEVKDSESVLPICSRSKDVIEPLLKSQWYVNCKDMAARAVKAVREKTLKIVPDFHEQVWYRWLEDCHDWCISRQLWWGHRIPAYHIRIKGKTFSDDTDNNYWVSAHDEKKAMEKALKRFPDLSENDIELYHDEDVLDTWFSSGIFPFSICGWPENTSDMEKYYPGTLLETGHDILFFWVARMVMMGEEICGRLPFDTIYLHAIIRDAHGRKMSKSLGNIIDPLDVIDGITLDKLNKQLELYNLDPKEVEKAVKGQKEDFPNGIPECGTDALRFALCAYTAQGRDINLDVLRIQGYRHFCNKLWNATKFAMMNGLSSDFSPKDSLDYLTNNLTSLRGMDKWMLSRLSETVKVCDTGFKSFDLTSVTTALFNYWLYDLCDYYIEYLKPSFYAKEQSDQQKAEFNNSREVLYTCLDVGLRLISPLMPFISEELYQRLPRRRPETDAPSICVTQYPLPKDFDLFRNTDLELNVKLSQDAISKIRSLRSDYQLTIKTKTDVYVKSIDNQLEKALNDFQDLILTMTNGKMIEFLADGKEQPIGCAFTTLSDKCKIYIMLKGIIDVDKEEVKLGKKKDLLFKSIETLKKEMAKPDYETRVPEAVRIKNQEKMSQLTNEVALIDEGLEQLQTMKS